MVVDCDVLATVSFMVRDDEFDGVLTEALAAPMVDSPETLRRSEKIFKGMGCNVAWW